MQPIESPTLSGRDSTVARQQQLLSNRALPTSGVGLLGERLLEGPDTPPRSRARRTPESGAPWARSLRPVPRAARALARIGQAAPSRHLIPTGFSMRLAS